MKSNEERKCERPGCGRSHYAKGLCTKHYQRLRLVGSVEDAALRRQPNGVVAIRNSDGLKRCSRCKDWVPVSAFARHGKTSDGLQTVCKNCHQQRNRFGIYSLNKEAAERLLESQNRKCVICDKDISTKYVIDHDHDCCSGARSCGKCVRGLLCSLCNTGLGAFKDNQLFLRKAIEYLERRTKQ